MGVLGFTDRQQDTNLLSGIMARPFSLPRKRDKVGLGEVETYFEKLGLDVVKTVPPGVIKPRTLARMFARFKGDEDKVIFRIRSQDIPHYPIVFLYGRFSDLP